LIRQANKAWHGVKVGEPDWSPQSRSIAFSAEVPKERHRVYLILNAYWEPLDFELPPVNKGSADPWRRWIDTGLDSPLDIVPWQTAQPVSGYSYRAEARSVVVLVASLGSE
jgi:glycogen operon protein